MLISKRHIGKKNSLSLSFSIILNIKFHLVKIFLRNKNKYVFNGVNYEFKQAMQQNLVGTSLFKNKKVLLYTILEIPAL